MCIPHAGASIVSKGFVKEKKPKKHVKRVSQNEFEKGDPDFVDERISEYKPQSKKTSFFSSIFGL